MIHTRFGGEVESFTDARRTGNYGIEVKARRPNGTMIGGGDGEWISLSEFTAETSKELTDAAQRALRTSTR